ncbi:hypothetical protein J7T55_007162 [Diaporthe amygdali]|uniref:uncharacterized protein n=1 Tax=Phomopsis amygdali TaxID=1214568 RepID=UPI0022FDCC9A|nr:uncharacterized protein J7T55_007162 [Diaporthe amygdali]KAJ0108044.1 hypothetical protein J7T55_007162 [Diaporthe amygdali]
MFARFHRLQEIHYEPWREWYNDQQKGTDSHNRGLIESFASNQLRKLVLFEISIRSADAAMMMPELETMEIWNGRKGLAALFKYKSIKRGERTAVITWRGTWELTLQPDVIQAWEAVIRRHCRGEFYAVTELLDSRTVKSVGDSIHDLRLSAQVIRPVSLIQIRVENEITRSGMEIVLSNL